MKIVYQLNQRLLRFYMDFYEINRFLFFSYYSRLKKCYEELTNILEGEQELKEAEEYKLAVSIANEAKAQLD